MPASRPGDFYHLEVRFRRAAVRATPVLGDLIPAGTRCDTVLQPALFLVVLESALHADEQLVVTHTHCLTPSKSTFSRTAQSGQHQSSGTSRHGVPAGNPSRGAPFTSS